MIESFIPSRSQQKNNTYHPEKERIIINPQKNVDGKKKTSKPIILSVFTCTEEKFPEVDEQKKLVGGGERLQGVSQLQGDKNAIDEAVVM